ncbi:hypothetical protein VTL71DRAFT_5320 [Oculimacula yallundae]|uniref:Heterokaryon incompatibility domain-containing protein n=1 Tax=Oculimacula yallundae TaxID=86028 RepID=A0ABR4C0W9_9HELO
MRLFNTQKVKSIEVFGSEIPPYAILSHTWSDGEILLQDLQGGDVRDASWSDLSKQLPKALRGDKTKGFRKVLRTTEIARQNNYDLVWVDTCCIDKTSSAELSEAINSMYRWYEEANICYAYLADVPAASIESPFGASSRFRRSRWFNRGWTLQELIASKQVELFASDWSYLGSKTGDLRFSRLLSEITGVQLDVVLGQVSPQEMSIAARMHWAAERQTTRVEDIAYCLLGIFDVNMPLLYGEGKRAFIRLQEAILIKEEDHSLFAWHSEELPSSTLGDSGQTGGLSGLLADSPDCFWDNNEIETSMPMVLKSSPSAVTSKGLRIDFSLLPCTDAQPVEKADYRVVLNCERLRDGQRESPVIYLKRIWGMGDQFARIRPDLRHFTPPLRNVLDVGLQERVFVRQDPWSDLRTIRISAGKDSAQLQLPSGISDNRVVAAEWKIKDAWPQKGWADNKQTFLTRDFSFGIPCGVLRLEINESGQPTTVDVAVGIYDRYTYVSYQKSLVTFLQRRLLKHGLALRVLDLNSVLKLESAFIWAKQEAESAKIVYNSLSRHNMHGTDVRIWIVVTERNRKGMLDIALHVLSDTPRIKIEQSWDGGYGQIIPVSTLSGEVLTEFFSANHLYHIPARAKETWKYWQEDTKALMGKKCVVDSITVSVFASRTFGSKVRIKSRRDGSPALGSLEKFCLEALPVDDATDVRGPVATLFGYDKAGRKGKVEAPHILEAAHSLGTKSNSWQLHPIHWAVIGGQAEIVRVLLDSDLGMVGISKTRLTPFHLAFTLADTSMSDLLSAAIHPDIEDVLRRKVRRKLLQVATEPMHVHGDYPLHFAAAYATSSEFWEACELSSFQIAGGPYTNLYGERPIHRAGAMGNVAAARKLMSVDADRSTTKSRFAHVFPSPPYDVCEANVLDLRGRTPLWHAACGDITGAIARILLKHDANPNAADHEGLTPVHIACRQGTYRFLKVLSGIGAHLNLPAGALGLMPSHFAAFCGNYLCLEILLKNQAKLISYTAEGASIHAFHLAIANGHEACARAIWTSMNSKPVYKDWSLCIITESSGPVLKWMYLQVDDQLWLAIDGQKQEGGTQPFVCFSEDGISPKLLVRPGVSKHTPREHVAVSFEDDTDEEWESSPHATKGNSFVRPMAGMGSPDEHAPLQGSSELKRLEKARRMMKSVFHK